MASGYFLTERDRDDLQEILRAYRSGAFAQPSKNKSHRDFAAIQEIAIGKTGDDGIGSSDSGTVNRWTVTDDEFVEKDPVDELTAYDWVGGGVPGETAVLLARLAHKDGTRWLVVDSAGGKINIYNDSGEEIPPFGAMAVSGVHTDPNYIKVTKPSTTFRRQYLPNGATAIPIAGTGSIPDRRYAKWLYNTGTPANDAGYGPTPGQWYLTLNYPAVTEVAGIFDASAKVVWGTVHTIDTVIGKLATALTPGNSATVNIWAGDGTEFEVELAGVKLTLSAKDWLMRSGSITSGTKVVVTWINGRAYLTEASCGP